MRPQANNHLGPDEVVERIRKIEETGLELGGGLVVADQQRVAAPHGLEP